ncbi:immunity protein YezG family protein [Staphylococcus aureus]
MDLYDLFEELRDLFKEEDLEPWTSCEFDFTREGELKVWEYFKVQINQKLSEPETKNIYSQRKIDVEPAFGFMKAILGFTRMSVRGIFRSISIRDFEYFSSTQMYTYWH